MDDEKRVEKPGVRYTEDDRRKWDFDYFARMAEERNREAANERAVAAERSKLQKRQGELKLDNHIGRVQVVNSTDGGRSGGVFKCTVCKCDFKDSIAYVDHLNGKKHQRELGMSMRVERSTIDQVRARLQAAKQKDEQINEVLGKRTVDASESELRAERRRAKKQKKAGEKREDADRVVQTKEPESDKQDKSVEKDSVEKKDSKEEPAASATEDAAEAEEDEESKMMRMMGLPCGFSTTK